MHNLPGDGGGRAGQPDDRGGAAGAEGQGPGGDAGPAAELPDDDDRRPLGAR